MTATVKVTTSMTDQAQTTVVDNPATPASPPPQEATAETPNQPATAETPYQPIPPGKPKFWTDDKIMDGLTMSGGNVSEACRLLRQKYNRKIGRSTVYEVMNNSPQVKNHAEQCAGIAFDICFGGVFERAQKGNPRDQRLLFQKLAGKHGMSSPQKIELTGADGLPIQHQEVVADGEQATRTRIAALADDEIANLLIAVKIINGRGHPTTDSSQSAASGTVA